MNGRSDVSVNLDRDEIRDHGVKGRTERESVPGENVVEGNRGLERSEQKALAKAPHTKVTEGMDTTVHSQRTQHVARWSFANKDTEQDIDKVLWCTRNQVERPQKSSTYV